MKARIEYGGGVFWLNLLDAKLVAGIWWIGRRDAENTCRRALGLAEWGYGKSNWAVYHEPTGLPAAWLRGRLQAEVLAAKLAEVWNGTDFNAVPLEIRNQVYRMVQDAPGRIVL